MSKPECIFAKLEWQRCLSLVNGRLILGEHRRLRNCSTDSVNQQIIKASGVSCLVVASHEASHAVGRKLVCGCENLRAVNKAGNGVSRELQLHVVPLIGGKVFNRTGHHLFFAFLTNISRKTKRFLMLFVSEIHRSRLPVDGDQTTGTISG
jgi:hypothetical protein